MDFLTVLSLGNEGALMVEGGVLTAERCDVTGSM